MFSRRRSRSGFSVVEVLIAASLSIGLGAMVAAAIASSSASSKNAITRASASQEVRQINEIAARYVRGAVRTPKCLLPATGAQSLSSCLVPADNGEMLVAASSSSITLLSYPEGVNVTSGTAPPPEKIVLRAVQETDGSVALRVESYKALDLTKIYGAQYDANTPTSTLRVVTLAVPKVANLCTTGLRPAVDVFSFLDDTGAPVTSLATVADRERVSVIKFDPQVRVPVQGEDCPRIVSSPVFLTLPSRGFGR
jgi:hypothetical protein